MLVHPQFDPIAIRLGPLAVHWYGITYLVAFGLFLWLAGKRVRMPQHAAVGWTKRDVDDVLFYGVLGVVLGSMVESNYRRALVLSGGDHWTFLQDRISAALLLITALVVIASLVRHMRDTRGSGDDRIVAGGQHT